MITIELDSRDATAAFARLVQSGTDMRPVMQQLGELLVETTKQRFETSTAPDGTPWAPNAESTYLKLLDRYTSSYGKTGKVSKGGASRAAGKKPLIGETKALSTTINYRAGSDFVEIGSPMEYAAVHQFGAAARSFTGGKTPWGDIPARPFLGLSRADEATIVDVTQRHLLRAIDGNGGS